jgi:hypothetical protein
VAVIALNIGGTDLAVPGYILDELPLKCDVLIGTDQIGKSIDISIDLSNHYSLSLFDSCNRTNVFILGASGELALNSEGVDYDKLVESGTKQTPNLERQPSNPSSLLAAGIVESEKHSILSARKELGEGKVSTNLDFITSNASSSTKDDRENVKSILSIAPSHVLFDQAENPNLLSLKLELESVRVSLNQLREELEQLPIQKENKSFPKRNFRSLKKVSDFEELNLIAKRAKFVSMIDTLAK